MYPRVICTCGYPIGDKYHLYRALVADYLAEIGHSDIAPEFQGLDTTDGISYGHILDALGLKLPCCREKMLTQVTFREVLDDCLEEHQ